MKEILFIHSCCTTGGIETFFIRLSRELFLNKISAKFVFLYKGLTEQKIQSQIEKYSTVYFWEDLVYHAGVKSDKLKVIFPLNEQKIKGLFSATECIHVDTSLTFFCAKRVISNLNKKVKLVFGVYHANELAWSYPDGLPYYEKFFRKILFSENTLLLFFNDFSKEVTKEKNNIKSLNCMLFPLGVDLPKNIAAKSSISTPIKMISIGRLVTFKAYNLFMPDLINNLNDLGTSITYDVYGDGPLYETLTDNQKKNNCLNTVKYLGTLDYSKIDHTLKDYDLFIGSGTALLQAAANGIPCIIAIENEKKPVSYGFFSDIPGIDYHEQRLPYQRSKILDLIISFSQLSENEHRKLSESHIVKASVFDIRSCAEKFTEAFSLSKAYSGRRYHFYFFLLLFSVSEFFARCLGRKNYSSKYDQNL